MRRMKLSRIGAGASFAIVVLTAWLGACSSGEEPCGNAGVKNGVCQTGPTCPSGSVELLTSDPVDSCPSSNSPSGENYICCVATDAAASAAPTGSGTSAHPG